MMMSKIFYAVLFIISSLGLAAQEFNLDIDVNAPNLVNADPSTLVALEKDIRTFFNETKWTQHDYNLEERIEGSIKINITDDPEPTSFVADIFIVTSRPVYSSDYSSPIINHVDRRIRFDYSALEPIFDNRNEFSSNLSSVLTYYAYIILGYDYDTFSPEGGTPYFTVANNILLNVPPPVKKSEKSWTIDGGNRSRHALITNLLDPRAKNFRRALYDYHRLGLDRMANDPDVGKASVLSALKQIVPITSNIPNSMVAQTFSNSKGEEILELFKNSIKPEQRIVYDVFLKIDASKADLMKELR